MWGSSGAGRAPTARNSSDCTHARGDGHAVPGRAVGLMASDPGAGGNTRKESLKTEKADEKGERRCPQKAERAVAAVWSDAWVLLGAPVSGFAS